MGVGMPQALLLQQFGEYVLHAFGHVCYHVGSSLKDKAYRDVDVRLLLPDNVYESMGLGDPKFQHQNKRWVALVLAWSTFGKALTGLPIDFQIQQSTRANAEEPNPRSALFLLSNFDKKHT